MYHKSKDYETVDKTALRLRIDYCHFEKKLNVFKLAEQLNIELTKYSSLPKEKLKVISDKDELKDGFTVFFEGRRYQFYTFYNDSIGFERARLTIAHEIKHVIFLEKNPSEKEEDLANHFARYILAPTCLVMPYVDNLSPRDIAFDFGISFEAASNAYQSAKNRKMNNKNSLNEYEIEFMNEFIKNQ